MRDAIAVEGASEGVLVVACLPVERRPRASRLAGRLAKSLVAFVGAVAGPVDIGVEGTFGLADVPSRVDLVDRAAVASALLAAGCRRVDRGCRCSSAAGLELAAGVAKGRDWSSFFGSALDAARRAMRGERGLPAWARVLSETVA